MKKGKAITILLIMAILLVLFGISSLAGKVYDQACVSNGDCTSNICLGGKCRCNAYGDCLPNAYGVHLICNTTSHICKIPFGQICTASRPQECMSEKCPRRVDGTFKCGCVSDGQCRAEEKCKASTGLCLKKDGEACTVDIQCFNGNCAQSHCTACSTQLVDGICKRTVGTACFNDNNCLSGFCKTTTQGNKACACRTTADCPAGRACSSNGGCAPAGSSSGTAPRTLNQPCTTNSQCQSGFCGSQGEFGILCSQCRIDSNCDPGKICNTATGVCQAGSRDPCLSLTGVDKIKCEINNLIGNMKGRIARLEGRL